MARKLGLTLLLLAAAPVAADVRVDPDDSRLRELEAYVASQFDPGEPGGVVLVARGDRVLLHEAYGLADLESGRQLTVRRPMPIGSITKSFTAAAILALVESGELELDDDVTGHVPDAPVGDHRVTIEQLLTHTSGMPNLVDVPGFMEWAREPRSTAELLERTRGVPFHFEPGQGYFYSDSGYILLGAVLERYHRGRWSDAIRDLVAGPLGLASVRSAEGLGEMLATGYEYTGDGIVAAELIDWSVPHASGSLVATAADLHAWARAWRQGHELRTQPWSGRRLSDGRWSGYGFGWQVCDFELYKAVQHGGFVPGYTASLLHLPTRNITAVALLNSTGKVEASYLTRRALRLLLTGSPDAVPHPLIAPERERLEGRYRTARGSEWVVASAPDGGMTIDLGGSRVPLVPTSGDRLCAADSDGTWCFDFDIDRVGPASSVAASLTCEPQGRAERVD